MRPPKPKPNTISQAQEPKVQSKVNPALSYGRATGKTYINKGAAKPKPKRKGIPDGRMVSGIKVRYTPKKTGGR